MPETSNPSWWLNPPILKNMLVKIVNLPQFFGVKNKNRLKPPRNCRFLFLLPTEPVLCFSEVWPGDSRFLIDDDGQGQGYGTCVDHSTLSRDTISQLLLSWLWLWLAVVGVVVVVGCGWGWCWGWLWVGVGVRVGVGVGVGVGVVVVVAVVVVVVSWQFSLSQEPLVKGMITSAKASILNTTQSFV